MYKIVIADDERMIREGLLSLDWNGNDMEIVGVAKNGVEAQEIIDSQMFDVLLTDIKMPGIGGLELAQILKANNPSAKTILLSGYGEFAYAQQAISLGVYGYILKPSTPEEIIDSVKRACEMIAQEKERSRSMEEMQDRLEDYEEVIGARKAVEKKGETEEKSTDIQDILKYIYGHYEENLTLSALASHFYFSSVYMSGYIKRYTGHTFLEVLTSVRMYHAAKLLKDTKLKNREIGMRVGIPDERYFGQVFKKTYGITPYEYRKSSAEQKVSLEEFIRRIDEETHKC